MESMESVFMKFIVTAILIMLIIRNTVKAAFIKCLLVAIINTLIIFLSVSWLLATSDIIGIAITAITVSFLLALFHKSAFREEEITKEVKMLNTLE